MKKKRENAKYTVEGELDFVKEAGIPYGKGIVDRTIGFSIRIINLYRELERDRVGSIIGKQLLRCATSIGANIHEAQGGQSKSDFISKVSIAYKESRETLYWLKLIEESKVISPNRLVDIKDEASQITKILSSIILTSKQNSKIKN